jgi:hypothetical protein
VLLADDASVQPGYVLRVLRTLMLAVICKAAGIIRAAQMLASHAVAAAELAHCIDVSACM